MQVTNMTSSRGNKIANQFIVEADDGIYFQSYNSVIAVKKDGNIMLDSQYWDYSATTGKYRNQFLGEGIADTRQKIKDGIYVLTNLN